MPLPSEHRPLDDGPQVSALDRSLVSPGNVANPDEAAASNEMPTATGGEVVPPPSQRDWNIRKAVIQAEYVSGGGHIFLSNYLRSLPQYIDDTTRDLGDDLYERMLLDPQVNSCLRTIKLSVLANGIRLNPAVELDNLEGESDDDPEQIQEGNQPRDHIGRWRTKTNDELVADQLSEEDDLKAKQAIVEGKMAAEICDFCTDVLEHLEGRPFLDICYEMLDGMALGNKVAEQVYDLDTDPEGRQRLYLKKLKVKPRQSTSFVVDPYNNVLGLLAILPGKGFPVTVGSVIGTPDHMPNLLPREKFAVFAWGQNNSDPRGSSILRAVYNPWWVKMQIWGEYCKYLAQFAGPGLVGTTSQDAFDRQPTDSLGNPIPGAPLITPEQAMLSALQGFRSSSVIALPHGSDVKPINVGGDGEAFLKGLELCNKEISKGILCQTLATEEGLHQAKAAADTHQDVLDMVVYHAKLMLETMIRRDILEPLVKYNYGHEAARRLTPKVLLTASQQHNWAKDATAVSALMSSQYLDPSQFQEMDARLGLPQRKRQAVQPGQDPNSPEAMAAAAAAQGNGVQPTPAPPTKGPKGGNGGKVMQG